jgi:hypothetical protein
MKRVPEMAIVSNNKCWEIWRRRREWMRRMQENDKYWTKKRNRFEKREKIQNGNVNRKVFLNNAFLRLQKQPRVWLPAYLYPFGPLRSRQFNKCNNMKLVKNHQRSVYTTKLVKYQCLLWISSCIHNLCNTFLSFVMICLKNRRVKKIRKKQKRDQGKINEKRNYSER